MVRTCVLSIYIKKVVVITERPTPKPIEELGYTIFYQKVIKCYMLFL